MGIYVEIPIRCSMDELWEKTQNPQLHQRWDLRFTQIEYLPRGAEESQKFLYRTRISFGLKIDGNGESTGTRDADNGTRTSSLKFWSEDPKSLIKVGSGYWKYVPAGNEICFFTWYDYETRFGDLGKAMDKCLFRPILGWATAWSFDRLRLWIERGIPPELLRRIGTPISRLPMAVTFAGWVEILFALLLIVLWRRRWPLWLTLALMLVGIPVVAISAPTYLGAAFNPFTLNLAIAALAVICIITGSDFPTAARCRRKPAQL